VGVGVCVRVCLCVVFVCKGYSYVCFRVRELCADTCVLMRVCVCMQCVCLCVPGHLCMWLRLLTITLPLSFHTQSHSPLHLLVCLFPVRDALWWPWLNACPLQKIPMDLKMMNAVSDFGWVLASASARVCREYVHACVRACVCVCVCGWVCVCVCACVCVHSMGNVVVSWS